MPRGYTLALLLLPCLLLGSGCNDGKKAEPKTDAAGEQSKEGGDALEAGAACDQALAESLEQELGEQCSIAESVQQQVTLPLAAFDAAPSKIPSEGRIEVSPSAVRIGWGREVPVERLAAELRAETELASSRGEPLPPWVLVIDEATPRARVSHVLDALVQLGRPRGSVVLGVKAPDPLPQPRDPARLAKVRSEQPDDPSQRATFFAKEIEASMPSCSAFEEAFKAVAMAAPERRCHVLARGLAEAMVECKCPDADELLTLVYGITVGAELPQRLGTEVAVTLDPAATPAKGETWGEVVAGLDQAAMKSLWLSG